jgi:hypothetical protein
VVGEKSKAQLSRSNPKNLVLTFAGIGKDVPTFADAQAIADQIVMLPEEYASIKILYNKFINAQSYEPTPIEAFSEEAIANSPNFATFEIDDEVLGNLREYALANALYWALAEGHACEQSARRNAMDVSQVLASYATHTDTYTERIQERRRNDPEIRYPLQQNPTSRHHGRIGGDHHWCYCFSRCLDTGKHVSCSCCTYKTPGADKFLAWRKSETIILLESSPSSFFECKQVKGPARIPSISTPYRRIQALLTRQRFFRRSEVNWLRSCV